MRQLIKKKEKASKQSISFNNASKILKQPNLFSVNRNIKIKYNLQN